MVHDGIIDTIAHACRVSQPHQDAHDKNTLVDDVAIDAGVHWN